MSLDHTNALLFVPFTRSRRGGWRLRKFWYTTHLPQLRVDYHWNVWQFSTFQPKKKKKIQQELSEAWKLFHLQAYFSQQRCTFSCCCFSCWILVISSLLSWSGQYFLFLCIVKANNQIRYSCSKPNKLFGQGNRRKWYTLVWHTVQFKTIHTSTTITTSWNSIQFIIAQPRLSPLVM